MGSELAHVHVVAERGIALGLCERAHDAAEVGGASCLGVDETEHRVAHVDEVPEVDAAHIGVGPDDVSERGEVLAERPVAAGSTVERLEPGDDLAGPPLHRHRTPAVHRLLDAHLEVQQLRLAHEARQELHVRRVAGLLPRALLVHAAERLEHGPDPGVVLRLLPLLEAQAVDVQRHEQLAVRGRGRSLEGLLQNDLRSIGAGIPL